MPESKASIQPSCNRHQTFNDKNDVKKTDSTGDDVEMEPDAKIWRINV
jgi:hypothetical protein